MVFLSPGAWWSLGMVVISFNINPSLEKGSIPAPDAALGCASCGLAVIWLAVQVAFVPRLLGPLRAFCLTALGSWMEPVNFVLNKNSTRHVCTGGRLPMALASCLLCYH